MTPAKSAFGRRSALLIVGLSIYGCATDAVAPSSVAPPAPPSAPKTAAVAFGEQAAAIREMGETPDWGEVADRMERLVRDHPRYGIGWYNLGVALERLGEAERATDAYRRALAVDDDLRAARVNLASLAMEARDEQTAVALLEALVEQDPSAIGAREALAQYRLDQDAQDDAERLAKEVLARDPARPGAYCVLAQVYARRNKAGQTRLLVAQGLVLHPDAACLHLALGRVLLNEGDTSGGLATLERAVAADPQLLEARFLIAEALMSFKDFPRAVVHYEAIAEQSPGSGPAWLNLGVAYKGAGRFEEAQKAYQRAAAIEQTAPAAQFNLGVLYLRHLDRLEEAQTALRQYMSLTGVDDREAMVLLEEAEQLQRFKTTSAEESAPSVDRSTTETTPSREAPSAASESSTPAVPPRSVSKPRNSPVKKTKPVAKPVPEVPEPDDFE